MTREEKILMFVTDRKWVQGDCACHFLAAGEYNENYLLSAEDERYVFRINHGTQLNLPNQIEYEFNVLSALESSTVTPVPYGYSMDSEGLGQGVLLMEYIPGRPLDYRRDLDKAAGIFARTHALPVANTQLIQQKAPLLDICRESMDLLERYPVKYYPHVYARLRTYHDDLLSTGSQGYGIFADEPLCLVNTEVNSGNFIIGPARACLVDWEKAVISCRYQDLAHFLVATTTLWKTTTRLTQEEKVHFLKTYLDLIPLDLELAELCERTRFFEKIILLRALSWCFMAYHEYALSDRPLQHDETRRKMTSYLNDITCFLT